MVGDSGLSVSSWGQELLFTQMRKEATGTGLRKGGDWAPGVGINLEGSVRYARGPESKIPGRQQLKVMTWDEPSEGESVNKGEETEAGISTWRGGERRSTQQRRLGSEEAGKPRAWVPAARRRK